MPVRLSCQRSATLPVAVGCSSFVCSVWLCLLQDLVEFGTAAKMVTTALTALRDTEVRAPPTKRPRGAHETHWCLSVLLTVVPRHVTSRRVTCAERGRRGPEEDAQCDTPRLQQVQPRGTGPFVPLPLLRLACSCSLCSCCCRHASHGLLGRVSTLLTTRLVRSVGWLFVCLVGCCHVDLLSYLRPQRAQMDELLGDAGLQSLLA